MSRTPSRGGAAGRARVVERVVSILNGVVGDYLHARGNALAIDMSLYHRDAPLPCEPAALRRAYPRATAKVCLLVHGLAENEHAWDFPGRRGGTYGTRLARELGFTPYAIRYNTGLRIAANGERLARLIEALVANHPVKVRRLVLVGHSMGGLVARSACDAAARAGHRWLGVTTDVVCIASPHRGAPLEKLGVAAGVALRATGNAPARLVADVLGLRSAGIRDLCFADLDGEGDAGDALVQQRRTSLRLPRHVRHRLVAGTLVGDARHPVAWMLGDGLVRVASATCCGSDRPGAEAPERASVRVFEAIPHRALAHDARVYRQLAAWCAEERR